MEPRTAQQAAEADAVARPQNRRHFEVWKQPQYVPDQKWRRSLAAGRWAYTINLSILCDVNQALDELIGCTSSGSCLIFALVLE